AGSCRPAESRGRWARPTRSGSGPAPRRRSSPASTRPPRSVSSPEGRSVASGSTPARQVLRARRFSISGLLGPDFDVNNVPDGVPGSSPFINSDFVVAADRFGKFAVAWLVSNGAGSTIYLRVFNSLGAP